MAPPIANRNATRHGLRAGALPKGCSWIRRDCDELRRVLEAAVAAQNNGNVDLMQAAIINSAMKWERHGLLVMRWLRMQVDTMDHATRLAYSRDIARASSERDKCLKELGLGRDVASAIEALYSTTPAIEEPKDD